MALFKAGSGGQLPLVGLHEDCATTGVRRVAAAERIASEENILILTKVKKSNRWMLDSERRKEADAAATNVLNERLNKEFKNDNEEGRTRSWRIEDPGRIREHWSIRRGFSRLMFLPTLPGHPTAALLDWCVQTPGDSRGGARRFHSKDLEEGKRRAWRLRFVSGWSRWGANGCLKMRLVPDPVVQDGEAKLLFHATAVLPTSERAGRSRRTKQQLRVERSRSRVSLLS